MERCKESKRSNGSHAHMRQMHESVIRSQQRSCSLSPLTFSPCAGARAHACAGSRWCVVSQQAGAGAQQAKRRCGIAVAAREQCIYMLRNLAEGSAGVRQKSARSSESAARATPAAGCRKAPARCAFLFLFCVAARGFCRARMPLPARVWKVEKSPCVVVGRDVPISNKPK